MGKSGLTSVLYVGIITACVGIVLSLTPYGQHIEEEMGLSWLFTLRGPRAAPVDVVVVTTDRQSAYDLKLPQETWKWPRSLHGKLVESLKSKGARIIGFDIFFKNSTVLEDDQSFADAIENAGNVVLFEKMTTPGSPSTRSNIFIRISPHPKFRESAVAVAPNPLPAYPFRVNQFWKFEPSDEQLATLPFVAYQLHRSDLYEQFIALLKQRQPQLVLGLPSTLQEAEGRGGVQAVMRELRKIFLTHPNLDQELRQQLGNDEKRIHHRMKEDLETLIFAYSEGRSQYLDFYGPPRSITTVPYSCVFDVCNAPGSGEGGAHAFSFTGKTVFVGFSEQVQSDQKDRFHTVFTTENGVYVSGVEITATAFANLLENRRIIPPAVWLLVLILSLWGAFVCFVFRMIPSSKVLRSTVGLAFPYIGLALVLGLGYLGVAYVMFSWKGWWMPTVIPLLAQLPVGLFGALVVRYREVQQERRNVQTALEHYVPFSVAQRLTKSIEEIKSNSQLVEGICLSTDAEHYTTLAESLELQKLRTVMNHYFEAVFEPVRRRGGIVSDVKGDSVLAIWAAPVLRSELRHQVCEAALEIRAAVTAFNDRHPDSPLPTRVGVHGGQMLLGNVGAMDHYEYRPLGDIVNTTSRIEGLNKYFDTHILMSGQVLEETTEFLSRELGSFQLAGKSKPVTIHELICREHEIDSDKLKAIQTFSFALDGFRTQRWDEAISGFETYVKAYGDDGPCRFYLDLCKRYQLNPPAADWEGVVTMTKK